MGVGKGVAAIRGSNSVASRPCSPPFPFLLFIYCWEIRWIVLVKSVCGLDTIPLLLLASFCWMLLDTPIRPRLVYWKLCMDYLLQDVCGGWVASDCVWERVRSGMFCG